MPIRISLPIVASCFSGVVCMVLLQQTIIQPLRPTQPVSAAERFLWAVRFRVILPICLNGMVSLFIALLILNITGYRSMVTEVAIRKMKAWIKTLGINSFGMLMKGRTIAISLKPLQILVLKVGVFQPKLNGLLSVQVRKLLNPAQPGMLQTYA